MIYINNNTDPQMVSIPRAAVAPSSSVTEYATEEYVDNAIAEAISGITGVSYEAGENIEISGNVISVTGMPDTSEFVTSGDVETQIESAISGLNPYSAGTNINIEDFVISVTGLPTSNTAFTNDAGYVNSGEVETMIENKQNLYTASTLSDITNPKEGDVACIITTASSSTSSWENISVDGFGEVLDEERFWGRTFKFHYDLSEDLYDEFQLFAEFQDENNQQVFYGVDCVEDPEMADYMFEYYSGSTPSVWNVYGGQDITITFPEDDGTLTFITSYNMQFPVLNEVLTIQEYVETTTVTSSSTQYSYVNGQWVETGTGSGGEHFVELTKAQYEALTGYAEDTTYIITDAPTVDLDNLATTGQVETKADKANVSANTYRLFPRWNTQGIITGSTGNSVYEQSLNINGTYKSILQTSSSSFGTIYAPTSAGTAGQILQSNGSGAPVWSSFKMWYGTQTQYDAITTKDNNTIYFVTDD